MGENGGLRPAERHLEKGILQRHHARQVAQIRDGHLGNQTDPADTQAVDVRVDGQVAEGLAVLLKKRVQRLGDGVGVLDADIVGSGLQIHPCPGNEGR